MAKASPVAWLSDHDTNTGQELESFRQITTQSIWITSNCNLKTEQSYVRYRDVITQEKLFRVSSFLQFLFAVLCPCWSGRRRHWDFRPQPTSTHKSAPENQFRPVHYRTYEQIFVNIEWSSFLIRFSILFDLVGGVFVVRVYRLKNTDQ